MKLHLFRFDYVLSFDSYKKFPSDFLIEIFLLKLLHWLPIYFGIQFKMCLLTLLVYKSMTTGFSRYFFLPTTVYIRKI